MGVVDRPPAGQTGAMINNLLAHKLESSLCGGGQLIIGTGVYGSLPIVPQVLEEARRRGIDPTTLPTRDA